MNTVVLGAEVLGARLGSLSLTDIEVGVSSWCSGYLGSGGDPLNLHEVTLSSAVPSGPLPDSEALPPSAWVERI
jgi:hypothetical protein